ncbi:hypothetical protein [Amycolatopsis sp. cmx-11-12]|uniref:hypothetical protein n=1 Tax=Amycolatopsis sp. cmx-11-12 TaxID=2785795 RepID=UPI00391811D0
MEEAGYNIAEIASLYSQLAGVLSGFAFTGLLLLLTARLSPAGSSTHETTPLVPPTRFLIVSFVGLLISSLTYAALAGDVPKSRRLASLELVAGLGFAASGLLLFYAIALTFDSLSIASERVNFALDSVGSFIRLILATILTPLMFFFLYLGIQDYNIATQRKAIGALDITAWALILLQIIIGTTVYLRLSGKKSLTGKKREKSLRMAASFALSLIIGVGIWFASLAALLYDATMTGPLFVPYLVLFVSFLSANSFVYHLARTRPAPNDRVNRELIEETEWPYGGRSYF